MDTLQYDKMVEGALRGVVIQALEAVAAHGLPAQHHFYITFETKADGVDIPDFLHKQYPEEMTIVLQHQFWDLTVDDEHFEVTLSFSGAPQRLFIPLAAVTSFFDPSVQFGLRFGDGADGIDGEGVDGDGTLPIAGADGEHEAGNADDGGGSGEADEDAEPRTGEIVSLDSFRKKT